LKQASNVDDWQYVRELQLEIHQQTLHNNAAPKGMFKLIDWRPLISHALVEVARKKSCAGVDGQKPETFRQFQRRSKLASDLSAEIMSGRYRPDKLLVVKIPKSSGGFREIGIPTVRDRAVQKACSFILMPIFETFFYEDSYAYRPQRGVGDAIRQLTTDISEGKTTAIKADIVSCFANLDRQLILAKLRALKIDEKLIDLIRLIIYQEKAHEQYGADDRFGICQGGNASPLLANLALHDLDVWFSRCCETQWEASMSRYCDDICVVSAKEDGEKMVAAIEEELNKQNLSIFSAKKAPQIINLRLGTPLQFLGHEIRLDRIKPCSLSITPKTQNIQRLLKRISVIAGQCEERNLKPRDALAEVNKNLDNFNNFYHNCNRMAVFDHINRRVVEIIARNESMSGLEKKVIGLSLLFSSVLFK